MRKRATHPPFVETGAPYPCHFGCGAELETKYSLEAYKGWEWFTGYGESPVHFCPRCKRERQGDIAIIREKLNQRPANYPHERAQL